MTRIVNNTVLHPTIKSISNWNRDIRTSEGPNTTSFISLSDIGIPYDSHYTSRIVLPADTSNFYLNYDLYENCTFLLIKVTYNGNYDYPNEDSYDPLYYHEEENYNITYSFENNTGKTYPIGRLLLLNGSYSQKIPKIYLNNPLDYDVVLDVFHANILDPDAIPTSSAITISNLYYNDIITDRVECSDINITTTTTTTINPVTTTTTTLQYSSTTTTTTTIQDKELMSIFKDDVLIYNIFYYRFTATGDTLGLFDYYHINRWIFAGERENYSLFTDLSGIERIRFYFDVNDNYYGILKTNMYDPIDHNTGLYFVDVNINGEIIDTPQNGNVIDNDDNIDDDIVITGSTEYYNHFTGSTAFIIKNYIPLNPTGYTLMEHTIYYNNIIPEPDVYFIKDDVNDIIYINTIDKYYILKFLTHYDFTQAYSRMVFAYQSTIYGDCRYLTEDHIYKNNVIVNCS